MKVRPPGYWTPFQHGHRYRFVPAVFHHRLALCKGYRISSTYIDEPRWPWWEAIEASTGDHSSTIVTSPSSCCKGTLQCLPSSSLFCHRPLGTSSMDFLTAIVWHCPRPYHCLRPQDTAREVILLRDTALVVSLLTLTIRPSWSMTFSASLVRPQSDRPLHVVLIDSRHRAGIARLL